MAFQVMFEQRQGSQWKRIVETGIECIDYQRIAIELADDMETPIGNLKLQFVRFGPVGIYRYVRCVGIVTEK